jgi:hypothetical protein
VIFVARFENLRILIVYLLAFVHADILLLVGLKFAGLHAFVVLVAEFEVDLHALLAF